MHDDWLVAGSMAIAATGITCLLFALILLEVPQSSISLARQELDGTPVRVRGDVRDVQHRGNITIITIEQPSTIDITIFEDVGINASCIIAQGKKGSYKGEAQITATKILEC